MSQNELRTASRSRPAALAGASIEPRRGVIGARAEPSFLARGLRSAADEKSLSRFRRDEDALGSNNLPLRMPTLKKAKRLALEEPLRRRILLVDDDADTLALTRIWLTQLGFDVSVAANGIEALSQIQEEPPDLIVTDQSMPRMTGLELCARLRARAKTRHIPIIMCSAQPLQPADGLYERALLKPASLAQLSGEIVSLLESRQLKLQQPQERGSG